MALLTLDEAKDQLRIDGNDDDATLTALIAAAAAHFEAAWGIVAEIGERVWIFDQFRSLMVLPLTPIDADSIVVTYLDGRGVEQTASGVRAVPTGKHLRLLPAAGRCWPSTPCTPGTVTVTAQAGYDEPPAEGEEAAPSEIPADIKIAARMTVAHWYENRGIVAAVTNEVPMTACALLEPYRLRRV